MIPAGFLTVTCCRWSCTGLLGMRVKVEKNQKSLESGDNELALGADLQLNQRNQ